MGLGKNNGADVNEKFSMSILAANISQGVNGVSWLHGEVSKDILGHMWPGYLPEELHVSYVTNGVHYPTWTAPEWKEQWLILWVIALSFAKAICAKHLILVSILISQIFLLMLHKLHIAISKVTHS